MSDHDKNIGWPTMDFEKLVRGVNEPGTMLSILIMALNRPICIDDFFSAYGPESYDKIQEMKNLVSDLIVAKRTECECGEWFKEREAPVCDDCCTRMGEDAMYAAANPEGV